MRWHKEEVELLVVSQSLECSLLASVTDQKTDTIVPSEDDSEQMSY